MISILLTVKELELLLGPDRAFAAGVREKLQAKLDASLKFKAELLADMAGPEYNGGGCSIHSLGLYAVGLWDRAVAYGDWQMATSEEEALQMAEEELGMTGPGDVDGRAELVIVPRTPEIKP